jgi:hypothetical protein
VSPAGFVVTFMAIAAAAVLTLFAVLTTAMLVSRRRRAARAARNLETDTDELVIEWAGVRADLRPADATRVSWLGDYPGRPPLPPTAGQPYRPRHGDLAHYWGVDQPTGAWPLVQPAAARGPLFVPVQVNFRPNAHTGPGRYGSWRTRTV